MPARITKIHSERVKEQIRTAQLLNRLQADAFGELKTPKGEVYELSPGRRISIMWLLERVIPKAQAPLDVALSGNITVVRRDPTQRPADYHRKGKASV